MTQVATRSAYGQPAATNNTAVEKTSSDKEVVSTTHYAYSLKRDDEGNIIKGAGNKVYLNQAKIIEIEGKFGAFKKLVVEGSLPVGSYFIARKKDSPAPASEVALVREEGDTSTTHYAYSLGTDGNKEFLNQVQIWENVGRFGLFHKMIINEPVAEGTYYIAQKRVKAAE